MRYTPKRFLDINSITKNKRVVHFNDFIKHYTIPAELIALMGVNHFMPLASFKKFTSLTSFQNTPPSGRLYFF